MKHVYFILIFLLFILFLPSYLNIPIDDEWDEIEDYANSNIPILSQIVFCPDYLYYFAKESHQGKFNNFDTVKVPIKESSIYESYYIIGSCKENEGEHIRSFSGSIDLTKADFKNYSDSYPFLTQSFKRGRVQLVQYNKAYDCPFVVDSYECGNSEWQKIKLWQTYAGGKYIKCIFTHPKDDALLKLSFYNITGNKIYFGFNDLSANDESALGNITFVVNENEKIVLNKENRYKEMPNPYDQINISVSTTDEYRNHVCFGVV